MDINYYKNKLEQEKTVLENELDHLGVRSTERKNDWEAQPENIDEISTRDEVSGRLTELGERQATEYSLEERLKTVNQALEKIKDGSYGLCYVCQNPIEDDRLEANPAAETCKTHIEEESK